MGGFRIRLKHHAANVGVNIPLGKFRHAMMSGPRLRQQ